MNEKFSKAPLSRIIRSVVVASAMASVVCPTLSYAQEAVSEDADETIEEIVVLGIRRSIQDASDLKRGSAQLIDALTAEDMGKLPDENAAASLKRITGVQIGNRNGQGSSIRIRGSSNVNIEVNGNTYVGAGVRPDLRSASSNNISLEDIPSELLKGIEVIKAPSADMNEGALTGTVNLKTRRPLDLDDSFVGTTLKNVYSDVADEDNQHYSLFLGKNWDDKIGVMLNITDAVTLSRNDAVNYRTWSSTPFIGANPDALGTPAHIVVTDSSGRTAVAISPRQIDMEQRSVEQDRLASNLVLQFRPTEELDVWFEGNHTTYDETVATNSLSLGIFDINTNAGIALDDFATMEFGDFTPGTTTVLPNGDPMLVDGEVTITQGAFRIPSAATGGDGHTANGLVATRDVVNTNLNFGGSWTTDDWQVTVSRSSGKSEFDSIWLNQSLKGSYGNVNGAFRNPRELDPYSGNPVALAENLRFGYNMNAGDLGSIFIDPTLTGVNPSIVDPNDDLNDPNVIPGGGDYITDPYSYAVGFTSLFKDLFISRFDSSQIDGDYKFEEAVITSVEFGLRESSRENSRVAERGVGRHYRAQCTLTAYELSPQECADNGGLFTDLRNGAEDGNSIYFQPESRQDIAMITDGSFMAGVDGSDGKFPARWISGNPNMYSGNPLNRLLDVWGMFPMADKGLDYTIAEDALAGYAKVNFEFTGMMVSGNFGVRIVETEVNSVSYKAADDAVSQVLYDDLYLQSDYLRQEGEVSYTDVLPSVNINWDFADDWKLRFAANRAMARPELSALIPGEYVVDVNNRRGNVGNLDLNPWRVNQADVSLEWYFDEEQGGSASLAVFHKDYTSFITTSSDITFPCRARGVATTCQGTQYVNGTGTSSGAEIGYNQPLPMGFGFSTNYTYLESEDDAGLPIPGNSENTYNLIAYYEGFGFGARLAYAWQDEALNTASGFGGRPEYTADRGQLDLSLNYDVNDNVAMTLAVTNLLEEGETSYVQIEERLLTAQQFDRTVVFSVRARL